MMLDIILTVIFQTGMKIIDWVMRGRGLRSGGTETQLSSSYNLVLWNFWLMEILRLNLGTILLEWNVVLFSRNLSRKRRTSYKKEWDFVVLQKFIKKDEGVIFEKRKLFCSSEIYLEWGDILTEWNSSEPSSRRFVVELSIKCWWVRSLISVANVIRQHMSQLISAQILITMNGPALWAPAEVVCYILPSWLEEFLCTGGWVFVVSKQLIGCFPSQWMKKNIISRPGSKTSPQRCFLALSHHHCPDWVLIMICGICSVMT